MRISRQLSAIQIMVDRKQPESVEEYFKYLGSIETNVARCESEIISRI